MWKNVTKSNPCPVCGKPDWCSVTEDGDWVACRRVDNGQGEHRVDRNGTDYWLYRLRPGITPRTFDLVVPTESDRADENTLDQVYRRLLAELNLSTEHRENLRKRGLPDEEINLRGYRSLPKRGRSELARRLLDTFGPETLAKVPGFYIKEEGGRQWWSLAGPSGLVIPCRDFQGRVVALKVRTDEPSEGGKYVYVSSKSHGGPGPSAPVHIPLWDGPVNETLRLTEGELKADVATVLSGVLTVSVPGVSCWRPAIHILKALSAKRVLLAFDADWQKNRHVAQALHRAVEALVGEGFEVLIETWPNEKKGIDDLLAAGETPENKKPEEINIGKVSDPVKEIIKKFGGNWPSIYTSENIRLIANLTDDNLARLIAEIKSNREAKKVVSVSKLEKLTKQARARLRAEERGLEVLPGSGNPEAAGKRTIDSRFPPAAEVLPEGFPFPDTGKKHEFYDIRGGKIVKVHIERDEMGERENITPIVDTVVLLTRRLDPVEPDAGIEKWGVAWWERGKWRFADVPARWLFDQKRVGELVDTGIPVSSANVTNLVAWLHALRVLSVLGQQGAPELPTVRSVSRCGWHELDGQRFFVWGREILLPSGNGQQATAGDREEIQPDAGAQTDADIAWAEDISAMERQILAAFRCSGDPGAHKRFLVETTIKYPQIALGIGCAAGAPLLRFAQAAGYSDVAGFTIAMVPTATGRSRHQGKTVWSQVVASLYGWPEVSETGRLRFADNTRVAMAVLFSTCADLPVHLEEVHKLGKSHKKNAGEEIDYLLHLASQGMDRGRGARAGGGRRTRGFKTVAFWTAETDVTAMLPPGSGAHDRIMKLPPLLPEESDANRDEAERLSREAMKNHGHAGREYLAWLVCRMAEGDGFIFIQEEITAALDILRSCLPTDGRRGSAGRLAMRGAIGMAGLNLLLESLNVLKSERDACLESFLTGWEMVTDNITEENVSDAAWRAVQSYIAANAERIKGMRTTEKPPAPAEWAGAQTQVKVNERFVEVIALREEEFTRAVSAQPFGLEPEQAKRALAADGKLLVRIKKVDNREKKLFSFDVRIAGIKVPAMCFPASLLISDTSEEEIFPETPF